MAERIQLEVTPVDADRFLKNERSISVLHLLAETEPEMASDCAERFGFLDILDSAGENIGGFMIMASVDGEIYGELCPDDEVGLDSYVGDKVELHCDDFFPTRLVKVQSDPPMYHAEIVLQDSGYTNGFFSIPEEFAAASTDSNS